jgi:hypothetical protein
VSRTFVVDVPVVPVLLMLDRYPDARGRYWCPFHDDERPGGKPSAEVRSDPCLLECWSCGANATAAELVAFLTECSLQDGLARAIEIAGRIKPMRRRAKKWLEPARLEAELSRQTEDVRYPRGVDPVELFVADRRWPGDVVAYLESSWGWAGDYRGRVVMPYRDAQGDLRGIRWRLPPTWEKSSRPRSSFSFLYGAWRLNGQTEVWLCEGETDTIWAGYHLERQGIGVVGLPGGRYSPHPDDIELLRGRRVVLVFDTDDVGELARERWTQALRESSELIQIRIEGAKDLCASYASPLALRGLYG